MVQKPHRERKFTDCHLTRRKASWLILRDSSSSFCIFPARSFKFAIYKFIFSILSDDRFKLAIFSLIVERSHSKTETTYQGEEKNLTVGR